jgi:hypothetical protein
LSPARDLEDSHADPPSHHTLTLTGQARVTTPRCYRMSQVGAVLFLNGNKPSNKLSALLLWVRKIESANRPSRNKAHKPMSALQEERRRHLSHQQKSQTSSARRLRPNLCLIALPNLHRDLPAPLHKPHDQSRLLVLLARYRLLILQHFKHPHAIVPMVRLISNEATTQPHTRHTLPPCLPFHRRIR